MRTFLLACFLCTIFYHATAGSNEKGIAFLEENKNKPGVITLPSGLQYKVLRQGEGAYHPTADSSCDCHYKGTLIDGTVFDSSYDRGQPTAFAPNQVIKGWTEAMQLMVEGDKWEMYIPSDLGYGDRGSPPKIGGGDTLIFQMELIKIKGGKVPALKCVPSTKTDCNEKEQAYIDKISALDTAGLEKELVRLKAMKSKPMTPELLNWLERRIRILGLLVKTEL
jgi:FKBP-type peptidyl-prolyl cis-trans isomerase FklB